MIHSQNLPDQESVHCAVVGVSDCVAVARREMAKVGLSSVWLPGAEELATRRPFDFRLLVLALPNDGRARGFVDSVAAQLLDDDVNTVAVVSESGLTTRRKRTVVPGIEVLGLPRQRTRLHEVAAAVRA